GTARPSPIRLRDLLRKRRCRAEAAFADGLHRGVATLGVQLAHDAVHVILDRELGQIQVGSDFLVGEAAREERNQLLLAWCKSQLRANPLVEDQRTLLRFSRDKLEQ